MVHEVTGANGACPYCRSHNILPYEDDSGEQSDLPVIIIILTALFLLALYFAFVLTSYMYFPVVVFIAIILTTRVINRQERRKKETVKVKGEYICLNCDSSFVRSDKKSLPGA